ncbi:J -like protein [Escherichia coli DEC10F]|nr:J -like protein [Escherichia coli DEC10F]
MPAGHGHMTLEFSVSAWLVNNWYPTASISDLLVVVIEESHRRHQYQLNFITHIRAPEMAPFLLQKSER